MILFLNIESGDGFFLADPLIVCSMDELMDGCMDDCLIDCFFGLK